MKPQIRKARPGDLQALVALMAEFYGEFGYPLNRQRAAGAFTAILSDDRLGHVWLIQADAEDVGYVVVTFGFSMEYGGRNAFLDDLPPTAIFFPSRALWPTGASTVPSCVLGCPHTSARYSRETCLAASCSASCL